MASSGRSPCPRRSTSSGATSTTRSRAAAAPSWADRTRSASERLRAGFGGVGESGFGRIHGPDGLKEFTYSHAITRQRFTPPLAMTTFRRTGKDEERAGKLVKALYGRGSKRSR